MNHLMAEPILSLSWKRADPETAVLSLAGELELFTAGRLEREARRGAVPAPGRVIVDLSRVRFIDSAGISALINLRRRLSPHTRLCLAGPAPRCRRILELVQFTRLVPVFSTLRAALDYEDE